MNNEMEKVYEPGHVESKWYNFWLEKDYFTSRVEEGKKSFTVVIPPPNVTGSLHMGHALNNTLQDIIIRFRRMQNYNPLWVPGTDHGGIATQNVVEKLLKAEGKTRHDLGRGKFIERMWQWRQESGDTILKQLRRLGCSLDWSRTRFTMDEVCSRAVKTAFIDLYGKGLIYRGKRLVNWCPRCHTALADIEVEHEEEIGKLWHIKYPIKGSDGAMPDGKDCVIVATTRPETMLGDTAVAVHPEDKRYAGMAGKHIVLPLTGREIPIVADAAVDPAFGTGAVKVTPAHDPVDFDIAARQGLPHIEVIGFNGAMTDAAGPAYAGLDRYAARKKVLQDLEAQGLLLETSDHPHAVGKCYRCATAIEPLMSEQWFLKVEDMSKQAMKVVEDGRVRIYPESWKKPYLLWLENLKDWCISRQIWWGHRIPVYYCPHCRPNLKNVNEKGCVPIAAGEKPERCPACGSADLVQDEDVLDTWFSSALWPFSVFGWPENRRTGGAPTDLEYYYPTAVLVTGHEILYLWVARMIQMGLQFMGDVPFRDVFIHGIVRDRFGKKMSKSLGNVIDPLVIMEQYGTDALRFAMTQASAPGRDMQLSEDSFVSARNFANKIWNASRFIMMSLKNVAWDREFIMEVWPLETADRWILSEYRSTVRQVTASLEKYDMDSAARALYDFFWSKYCDWYIEIAKIRINGADEQARKTALSVLMEVLSGVTRLLHPVMPFITEEIWQNLRTVMPRARQCQSVMEAPWPEADAAKIDGDAQRAMAVVMDAVTAVRTVRSEMNVHPGKNIPLFINAASSEVRKILSDNTAYVKTLAKLESLEAGEAIARPAQSAVAVAAGMEIFIPLAGLIDLEKEKKRLSKERDAALAEQERCRQKMSNASFLERAPEKEIARIRERLAAAEAKMASIDSNLKALG